MSLVRSFPLMTITLVMLAIVGHCAAQQSVELLLVAGTLAALSWYVTEGPRGRTLPRWVSNVLVVAVSISVVVDLLVPPNDVLAVLGRFGIWLLLIKLYERRTARDHAHLMALSLLLMLIGCLRTTSLLFGIVLLVYAALGLYVLLLFRLFQSQEQATAARRRMLVPDDGREPGPDFERGRGQPAARPTIGRHVVLHFRGLALFVAVAGVALSIALFLIFPRHLGRELFQRPLRVPSLARTTGYTDQIDLNGGTRINELRRLIGEVEVHDADGLPVVTGEPLYLRGAVLARYERGRWLAHRGERSWLSAPAREWTALSGLPGEPRTIPNAKLRTCHVRLHRGTTTIFAPYLPVAVQPAVSRDLMVRRKMRTATTADKDGLVWDYDVLFIDDPADTAAVLEVGPVPRPRRLGFFETGLHPDAVAVREHARELVRAAGLPERRPRGLARWGWNRDVARVFADHLHAPPFRYTLDVRDVVRGTRDPIAQFLFETKRGHCEYFASAHAALCRAIGVDACVVTGYVAYEYDHDAQQYLLLASNAHAWVEVRTGLSQFTTVDPTPPGELRPQMADDAPLLSRMGWLYQRLEGAWTGRVIAYDGNAQVEMLQSLDAGWTAKLRGLYGRAKDWIEGVNRAFYFGPAGYIWLGIVAFALGIALVAGIRFFRRLRSLHRTLRLRRLRDVRARRLLRQLGFYLDMLTLLARGGHPKPDWQPPLAYAAALGDESPERAAVVARLSELYYAGRYGGRRLTPDELARTRADLDQAARLLGVRR